MKRIFLLFTVAPSLLIASIEKSPDVIRNELSEMKQELAIAHKKLIKQKAYIEQLEEEIARNEIALIQKEVSQIDQNEVAKQLLSQDQWLELFHQQREILSHIIRKYPTCRRDAQDVLDKILTLITQMSDQAYE